MEPENVPEPPLTPTVKPYGSPPHPEVTVPPPVSASTLMLPSTPAKIAPPATFKDALLLVQTSLLLLAPVKDPA